LSSDVPSNLARCQGSPHKVELTTFVSERELFAFLLSYVPSKLKRCLGALHKVELTNLLNERELFCPYQATHAAEVNKLKRCRFSPSFRVNVRASRQEKLPKTSLSWREAIHYDNCRDLSWYLMSNIMKKCHAGLMTDLPKVNPPSREAISIKNRSDFVCKVDK
jgi:hypothetical protein